MLSQFIFGNYKSFKDETILDLTPANIREHKESLIIDPLDGEKFLPVAVMYGPNGGGKSTVLEAIFALCMIVLKSVVTVKLSDIDNDAEFSQKVKKLQQANFSDKYFKFNKKYENIPIAFDILFRTKQNEYRYQLCMLKGEVVEENLYMRELSGKDAQIVFERNQEDSYLGNILEKITADKIKSSIPLLSYIAITYDIDIINDVINWFLNMEFINYDNPYTDQQVPIPQEEKYKKLLLNIFKQTDINIVDFTVKEDENGNIVDIFTKHKFDMPSISFTEESSGTRKLFGLLVKLIESLQEGYLVIVDEIDAKLHPKLLRYLIELFTNPKINKKGAQLLFTSHDMTTMTSEIFRRDEIWFCALDEENSSHLYSLISFKKENGGKTRSDEAYGKQYLEGRYGADPYLERMLTWEEIQ